MKTCRQRLGFVGTSLPELMIEAQIIHEACLAQLVLKGGMERDEAQEYFEYNIIGAYVGEKTPCFITVVKKEKNDDKG